jgi:signal transduction histidine kinase
LLKHVGKKQMFGIRIEDQGIGMTPDELNHIGERFYRADTTGTIPGTGLGVSLVKEIIELHKGELEITSTLGQGAQFTVWLPVDPKNIQSVKRSV